MNHQSLARGQEPTIAVGLLDRVAKAQLNLTGPYTTSSGRPVAPGELTVTAGAGRLECRGVWDDESSCVELAPGDPDQCSFSLEMTIGIDFHWQQQERQSFRGELVLLPMPEERLTLINRVPLETYLTSVVCSEMKATAPPEFIKAHTIIARSWLLAQLWNRPGARAPSAPAPAADEQIRWTDREAHDDFDVCADDHCQRYQGILRINQPGVREAVEATRGEVLTFEHAPCDARYSKCCGGVIEEFSTAWNDEPVPYLVALRDAPGPDRTPPPLLDDAAMRAFLDNPPPAYCDCKDDAILSSVLNEYDLTTRQFFRWDVRLTAAEATELVRRKLGIDLGRIIDLVPVERGPSGRLKRLRLVGDERSLVIGKELEIRRALSESHLYSSAFVVDREGEAQRPDAFRLRGAGWGHGVGLCQIGAAIMAHEGAAYRDILAHYYPGAQVETFYS